MPHLDLSDDEAAALIKELRRTVDNDRYPLSPRNPHAAGDPCFVRVDCAACHHVALLTPEFLVRLGLSPQAKVLDLKERVGSEGPGTSRRFDQVGAPQRVSLRISSQFCRPGAGEEAGRVMNARRAT
jgi:hypothetical protein